MSDLTIQDLKQFSLYQPKQSSLLYLQGSVYDKPVEIIRLISFLVRVTDYTNTGKQLVEKNNFLNRVRELDRDLAAERRHRTKEINKLTFPSKELYFIFQMLLSYKVKNNLLNDFTKIIDSQTNEKIEFLTQSVEEMKRDEDLAILLMHSYQELKKNKDHNWFEYLSNTFELYKKVVKPDTYYKAKEMLYAPVTGIEAVSQNRDRPRLALQKRYFNVNQAYKSLSEREFETILKVMVELFELNIGQDLINDYQSQLKHYSELSLHNLSKVIAEHRDLNERRMLVEKLQIAGLMKFPTSDEIVSELIGENYDISSPNINE